MHAAGWKDIGRDEGEAVAQLEGSSAAVSLSTLPLLSPLEGRYASLPSLQQC